MTRMKSETFQQIINTQGIIYHEEKVVNEIWLQDKVDDELWRFCHQLYPQTKPYFHHHCQWLRQVSWHTSSAHRVGYHNIIV